MSNKRKQEKAATLDNEAVNEAPTSLAVDNETFATELKRMYRIVDNKTKVLWPIMNAEEFINRPRSCRNHNSASKDNNK